MNKRSTLEHYECSLISFKRAELAGKFGQALMEFRESNIGSVGGICFSSDRNRFYYFYFFKDEYKDNILSIVNEFGGKDAKRFPEYYLANFVSNITYGCGRLVNLLDMHLGITRPRATPEEIYTKYNCRTYKKLHQAYHRYLNKRVDEYAGVDIIIDAFHFLSDDSPSCRWY